MSVLSMSLFYDMENNGILKENIIPEYTKNKLLELSKKVEENLKLSNHNFSNNNTNSRDKKNGKPSTHNGTESSYQKKSKSDSFGSSSTFTNKQKQFTTMPSTLTSTTALNNIVFSGPAPITKSPSEIQLSNIKIFLNKMTDKNYDKIKESIISIMNDIKDEKLYEEIFLMLSDTIFNSKLYAKLYDSFIQLYPIFQVILEKRLNNFLALFMDFVYIEDDKNYTEFCKMNKEMDKRKGFSTFCINLNKNGILSDDKVFGIIKDILQTIANKLDDVNNKNLIDDLTEHLFIYLSNEDISKNNNLMKKECYKISWKEKDLFIYDFIELLKSSSPKIYKGLTSKSVFKFQDIFTSISL